MNIISFDPGITTGIAYTLDFDIKGGDIKTHLVNLETGSYKKGAIYQQLNTLFRFNWDMVLCEQFILYPHKAMEQTGSHMETTRVIGAIEYLCHINEIPLDMKLAKEVKGLDLFTRIPKLNIKGRKVIHCHDAFAHLFNFVVYTQHKAKKTTKGIPF